jgi:hypothetical protein
MANLFHRGSAAIPRLSGGVPKNANGREIPRQKLAAKYRLEYRAPGARATRQLATV